MHVLVATDGSADVDEMATFAHALAGEGGRTTVTTIVLIPRQLLPELRAKWGEAAPVHVDSDSEYVGTLDVTTSMSKSWPGDDAVIKQYLGNKRVEICRPVTDAIRALGGSAESDVEEGTDIAAGIMSVAASLTADVIVVGSHGHGAFPGLLGSTGSKLVRRAKRPVLILR